MVREFLADSRAVNSLFLSGILPRDVKSRLPQREATPADRRKRELTGALGKMCEGWAFQGLLCSRPVSNEDLGRETNELLRGMMSRSMNLGIKSKRYYDAAREEMVQLKNAPQQHFPERGALNELAVFLSDHIRAEAYLGRSLSGVYDKLRHWPRENMSFFAEAMLFFSKLLYGGDNLAGWMPPNTVFEENILIPGPGGKGVAQFDGVITRFDDWETSWPPDGSYLNFLQTAKNPSHTVVEVKTVMNAEEAQPGRLMGPRTRDLAYIQHRLGLTALAQRGLAKREDGTWVLPESVMFIYARGSQPSAVHLLRLDSAALEKWREGIWERMDRGITPRADIDTADVFMEMLKAEAARRWGREEGSKVTQTKKGLPVGEYSQESLFLLESQGSRGGEN